MREAFQNGSRLDVSHQTFLILTAKKGKNDIFLGSNVKSGISRAQADLCFLIRLGFSPSSGVSEYILPQQTINWGIQYNA